MTLDRILPYAKHLLEKCVVEGETVVDATCGNGNDTLFLSRLVGPTGKVVAFDVQMDAIENTRTKLLAEKIEHVALILDGHEQVKNYVKEPVSAAIFNLGYLPGSDKTVTTNGETTWCAVVDLLDMLKIGGLIILVVYHGHESGKIERNFIEEKIKTLDVGTTAVLKYEFLNKENAPYILAIEKIK